MCFLWRLQEEANVHDWFIWDWIDEDVKKDENREIKWLIELLADYQNSFYDRFMICGYWDVCLSLRYAF